MGDDLKAAEPALADAPAEDASKVKLAFLAALAAAAVVGGVEGTRPAAVLVTVWDGERYTLVRSEAGKVPAAIEAVAGTTKTDGTIGVTEKGLEERDGAAGWDCACGPALVEDVLADDQHKQPAFTRTWAEGGNGVTGNVLQPGRWRVADSKLPWARVPCIELGGKPHNPPECL